MKELRIEVDANILNHISGASSREASACFNAMPVSETSEAEMMRCELQNVINRWIKESDVSYADLFGVLEILKLTYWQSWTEDKRKRGDFK